MKYNTDKLIHKVPFAKLNCQNFEKKTPRNFEGSSLEKFDHKQNIMNIQTGYLHYINLTPGFKIIWYALINAMKK